MENMYQHKKFDQRKRSRDDCSSTSSASSSSSLLSGSMLANTEENSTSAFMERFGTPSSVCTDLSGFTTSHAHVYPLSSTPLVKRRKIMPLEDSGIGMSSTFDATAVLPKITNETLASICKYHGNMVRKFPKKERTPKDQERRNKNTIACRMSRRVKKLEHIAIEEQYKEFAEQHMQIVEESMRAAAYLNELLRLNGVQGNSEKIAEHTDVASKSKKPFTIAYLVGADEK